MRRRRVLATIGATVVTSIAGCGAQSGPTTPTATLPPFDEQDCPPYDVDLDGAVCSHTVDPDEAAVSLDATPSTAMLEGGTPATEITLTLHDDAAADLRFNPYSWTISRWSDPEWEPLEKRVAGDARVTVAAGDAYSWSFVEAVEAIRTDPALDTGLYAAEIGVPDPASSEDWIACIALVRLTAAE